MTGTLITPTVKAKMQPLAFQGIMAYTRFPQITAMLRNKLGDSYALLFAEPVENPNNGLIDWYTPMQGAPRRLDDLPGEEKDSIIAAIKAMACDLDNYADELIATQEPQKVTRGHILKLAIVCPDYRHIYVMGQQPVIVAWGFGPGTPGVEPKSIAKLAVARPLSQPVPPKPGPAQVVPQPGHVSLAWLWWLLPLLAAFLLFVVLCTAFGNLNSLSGYTLFHAPGLPFYAKDSDRSAELASLEEEIAVLLGRLDEYAAICVQKQDPAVQKQPDDQLVIPPDAEDMDFLEGKWLCDTGLASMRTGEPVSLAFSFDENGKGSAITYEADDSCAGPVSASLKNGELHISVGESICQKDNHVYEPVEIICSRTANAVTQCQGRHKSGHAWAAPFRRVR